MPNMRQDNRRTSSATRQARIKGTAGGSQPRPRPTQVSTMKQQGPLKPKTPATSSETRNPNRVRAGVNQNNKPGAGRVTGTMGRPKPSTPARVTASNRTQSPRLPNLPRNPVTGTTNTIRATGGGSRDAKINRLSAQTRPITGSRALAPVTRGAGAGAAMRGAAGKAGAVGVGANLFMQGKSGSVVDQAVKKLPGIKANPKTDLGKRAGDAISRTASQAAAALKKQLKKAKMGY